MPTILRFALALAIALLVITPLVACGGGDEEEQCPQHAEPPAGKKTIPTEPCGDSTK